MSPFPRTRAALLLRFRQLVIESWTASFGGKPHFDMQIEADRLVLMEVSDIERGEATDAYMPRLLHKAADDIFGEDRGIWTYAKLKERLPT